MVQEKFLISLAAAFAIADTVFRSLVPEESADIVGANPAVSLFGPAVMLFSLWATSCDRKKIRRQTVSADVLTQFAIAEFVLRTKADYDIFNFTSGLAGDLLRFANHGLVF